MSSLGCSARDGVYRHVLARQKPRRRVLARLVAELLKFCKSMSYEADKVVHVTLILLRSSKISAARGRGARVVVNVW